PKGYFAVESRNLPKEGETLERYVEREFSRHGSWMADYVDRNYKDDKKWGQVSLGVITEKPDERKIGLIDTEAVYFPKRDTLCFVQKPGKSPKKVSEPAHHELWHALFDEEGVKGLIRQAGYKGPSVEEIEEFAKKMTSGKDFEGLKEGLDSKKEMVSISSTTARMLSRYGGASKSYHRAMSEITREIDAGKGFGEYVEIKERDEVLKQLEELDREGKDLDKLFIEFADWFSKKAKDLKKYENGDKMPRKELREFYRQLQDFGQRFKKYDKIPDLSVSAKNSVVTMYEHAEDRQLEAEYKELGGRIADLKKQLQGQKDGKTREYIEESIKSVQELKADLQSQEKSQKDMRKLKRTMDKLQSTMSSFDKLRDLAETLIELKDNFLIDEILENPDEIMARFFDSLFSFYIDSVTDKKFPLTEEHRKFFERFEYRGEKMFERYIELHRIAEDILKVVEDTSSRGSIIKVLQDADTIIAPDGRRISALVSPFRIDGRIPPTDWVEKSK
ncbi:MAG TPA: hypothetical protein VJB06_02980, partial [archaeon]|nr:hypothetical protein [archaeon]